MVEPAAYVDASGDDGYKFDKGSSRCYVVALLLVEAEDHEHNFDRLHDIRKLLSAAPEAEVKWKTIRHHKRRTDIVEVLAQTRGILKLGVAYKHMLPSSDIAKRVVGSLLHLLAISTDARLLNRPIYVDRLKKPEEDVIRQFAGYAANYPNQPAPSTSPDVRFVDSKRYKLIQLADCFAGLARDFFEEYSRRRPLPCSVCMKERGGRGLCKYYRAGSMIEGSNELTKLSHLIDRHSWGQTLLAGFVPYPVDDSDSFRFVDCLIFRQKS